MMKPMRERVDNLRHMVIGGEVLTAGAANEGLPNDFAMAGRTRTCLSPVCAAPLLLQYEKLLIGDRT
ncbi:hypothetical protein ASD80_08215 [Devosia sp. Root635]|nr:hypothetical protein ASD80_08215 [Devosia sp. Root635]